MLLYDNYTRDGVTYALVKLTKAFSVCFKASFNTAASASTGSATPKRVARESFRMLAIESLNNWISSTSELSFSIAYI